MDNRYTNLITSQYTNQPNFMAMMEFLTQFFIDQQNTIKQFNSAYDLDTAIGIQLDTLGLWIGISRNIPVYTGLQDYFSWDIAGSGWNQKDWYGVGDPLYTIEMLEDEEYRTVLKTKAAANDWDGTINGAYEIYDILFSGTRTSIKIHDYQNMTYALEIVGVVPDAPILSILSQDMLNLRPEGVQLLALILPS